MLCYVESIRGDRVTLQVVKLIRNLLMLSDGYTAHVALSRADLRRTLRRELIDAGSYAQSLSLSYDQTTP